MSEPHDLAVTQRERCLGCGEVVPCRCFGRYQTGPRVSYEAWSELVGRHTDEPLFRVWAEAEPMCGVPSWFCPVSGGWRYAVKRYAEPSEFLAYQPSGVVA